MYTTKMVELIAYAVWLSDDVYSGQTVNNATSLILLDSIRSFKSLDNFFIRWSIQLFVYYK